MQKDEQWADTATGGYDSDLWQRPPKQTASEAVVDYLRAVGV